MKRLAILAVFTATAACGQPVDTTRPRADLTPGAVATTDPKVVCVRGYSASVRNVTWATKKQVFARYGITSRSGQCSAGCEVDHLISLELGGSNDIKNLWPQPYSATLGAHEKDALEDRLHGLVCSGRVTLQEAQTAIAKDWIAAYHRWMK